ncbi:MAG TPA: pseudouridine synthase [Verrucomicrobiae bacterium]|nr:pseudouridine synthase [Verrucomicrobiae bacterium]
MSSVRLQKVIAEAGIASRRAAEQIILAGRVDVNGETVRTLGQKVRPGVDRISVDGVRIKAKRKLYVAVHKPKGYLCTRKDPFERRTIGDLLPAEWAHLASVGRLDNDSEGLIFMTNDGEFTLRLSHPRYAVRKTYHLTVEGKTDESIPHRFKSGVEEGGERLKAVSCRVLSINNTRTVLEVVLVEGKNRELRRMCLALGLTALRVHRVQIGPIKIGELRSGKWRTLTEAEIKSLLSPV